MKLLNLLMALCAFLSLASCAVDEDTEEQPIAPWTYPTTEYQVIKTLAGRVGENKITRLVGWDEDYYFFDWSEAGSVISRGTGRVEREQFNVENQGALPLGRGQVAVRGGKVRSLILQ